MQMLTQQELRGRSFLFICLGIYKSLTWYNGLIKRKQNTQNKGGVSSLAPILPKRHTHLMRGFGGLLPGNQADAQKARLLCEEEEGPLPHTSPWGCGVKQNEATGKHGLLAKAWSVLGPGHQPPEENQSLQAERGSWIIQETVCLG